MTDYLENEKVLLEQIRNGDDIAFEKIYKHYSTRLLGYLIRLVKIEEVAAELLQVVFIKIWDKRESLDTDLSFKSYLFRIAENEVYSFFRKSARSKKLQQQLIAMASENYIHVEETLLAKEDSLILDSLVASLPPHRRQVFRLVKMEGKTYAEVSEALNISTSTISDHVVKATKYIRRKLEKEQSLTIGMLIFSALYL